MSSENAVYEAGVMQKASALIIPCFVYLAILGVPLNFSAIIELYSVDVSVATIATTVEIAAIALASLFISFTLPKLNPRLFYVAGVGIAASGQLLTLLMESFDHAVIIRGFVGLGEGVILGIGFASLAQMQGGAKLLGISSGVTAGICFVEFMVVPMLAEHVGSGAVFWFLCAGFILLAPLSFFLPSRKIVRTVVTEASPKKLNSRNISLFLMALLISIGANSLWLYFDQIGKGLGLSPVEVGWIGSISMLVAILVPFIIGATKKLKGVYPLLLACFMMALTCYVYVAPSSTYLWASVVVYMTVVYLFALAAARVFSADLDSSGSTTAAVGSADVLGMVVGPVLVALALNLENSLLPLAYFATGALVLCVVPALIIIGSMKTSLVHCGCSAKVKP